MKLEQFGKIITEFKYGGCKYECYPKPHKLGGVRIYCKKVNKRCKPSPVGK